MKLQHAPLTAIIMGAVLGAAPVRAADGPRPSTKASTAKPGSIGPVAQQAPATPAPPSAPAVPAAPSPELGQPQGPGAAEGELPFTDPTGVLAPVYEGLTGKFKLEPPKSFPVHMVTVIDHSVGVGSFMLNQWAKQPYFASTVRLQPSVNIWKSLRAQMVLQATKEWIASSTQTYAVPNQAIIQDLWLGLAMPNIYTEEITGIGVGAGLWVFAPASLQSRTETLIVGGRPFATLSWNKWGISAAYTISFRKNFHQYTHPMVDAREGNVECTNTAGRCFVTSVAAGPVARAGESDLQPIGGGKVLDLRRRNVSHQLLNFVTLGYTLFDSVSLSATGVLINTWRYPLERDPALSSVYANNVWGHSDAYWVNLDLSYQMFDKVGFSTGLFTFQPFFMQHRGSGMPGINQDGRSSDVGTANLLPSLPFVDGLLTPGNNYTTAYFDVVIAL